MYSEYFKAMIKIQMQEPHENTVDIKDFDSKVIKFLIDYMYGEQFLSTLLSSLTGNYQFCKCMLLKTSALISFRTG